MGATPVGNSPQQFDAFMRAEAAKWEPVLKEANIKVQWASGLLPSDLPRIRRRMHMPQIGAPVRSTASISARPAVAYSVPVAAKPISSIRLPAANRPNGRP